MAYTFKIVDSTVASDFWERSPDRTPFTCPSFLSVMADGVEYWAAYKNDELACLWPVPLAENGLPKRVPFSYYIGPMWSRVINELPIYRWYSDSQIVYNGLFESILARHESLSFDLPLTLNDVRAFSWWNYHSPELPRFEITPRCTARIEGLGEKGQDSIIGGFKKNERRSKIRKILKDADYYERTEDWNASRLIDLYCNTMIENGAEVSQENKEALEKIIGMCAEGRFGDVVALKRTGGREVVAAQVRLKDDQSTHAVARCVESHDKKKDAGILLTYLSIMKAKEDGHQVYDFNGANSPNRADDKHAYGAVPRLYFSISI